MVSEIVLLCGQTNNVAESVGSLKRAENVIVITETIFHLFSACVVLAQLGTPHAYGGSVNAFLAAALTRVMRAAVSFPAVASASVLHSAAVGGSVVGVVRPL